MDRGDLVPDDVIIGLIAERLESGEADRGFILDGFPRTVPQAEALDAKLAEIGRQLTAVILIDAPDEEIIRRLSGRRVSSKGALRLPRRVQSAQGGRASVTSTVPS